MSEEYKKNFLAALKNLSHRKNWSSLAELIEEKLDALTPFVIRNTKISLHLLAKLSDLLVNNGFDQFTKNEIEKHIVRIGAQKNSKEITNPKIPFNFANGDGMIFISAIMHDGGIMGSTSQPFYVNFDISMRKYVNDAAQNVFGKINSKAIDIKNTQITFPKIIGILLIHGIGLEKGDKTIRDIEIPEFVKAANANLKCKYLQQAFDDEGCVGVKRKTISFKSAALYNKQSALIQIVQKMLEDIEISSKIKKDCDYISKGKKKTCWVLHIHGKNNLEVFSNNINFKITKKRQKLYTILTSYKQEHNKLWKQVLLTGLKKIQEEKRDFNYKDIKNLMNKSYNRTSDYIDWLVSQGIIIKIKDRTHDGPCFVPCVYTFSQKYKDQIHFQ